MADYLEPITLSGEELASLKKSAHCSDAYRFLDLDVRIHSDSSEILEFFREIYSHFSVTAAAGREEHHSYYVLAKDRHCVAPLLIWDDTRACALETGKGLADSADIVILGSILRKNQSFFLIHGAALSCHGRGLVLAGMSGSGKSTLALELTRRGLKFCSDEIAAISRQTQMIHPFPRAIGIREGGHSLLHGIGFVGGQMHETVSGEKKQIVDIEDLFASSISDVCSGRHLVLLDTNCAESEGGAPKYQYIRVAVKRVDHGLIGELCDVNGVKCLSSNVQDPIRSIDFRVEKSKPVQRSFLDVCRRYDDTILYRVKVVAKPPNPAQDPSLVPMSKLDAGVEVLGNLQNLVANDGWMSTKSTDSTAATLFELLGPIGEMDCYRLVVGNLKRTADLIVSLVK